MRVRLFGAVAGLIFLTGPAWAQSGQANYIVTLRAEHSINGLNASHGTHTVRQIPNTPIYLIQSNQPDNDNKKLGGIQNDPKVMWAEADQPVKLRARQQSLPYSSLQQLLASSLDGKTLTTFYGSNVLKSYVEQPALILAHINEDVRNRSTGAGTRVAYIDTGVDPYHPALAPWLDPGIDVLNNRSTSESDGLTGVMESLIDGAAMSLLDFRYLFTLDGVMQSLLDGGNSDAAFPSGFGHGTLVAGVIHLVAPNARIVPIKAFDAYGNTTMFNIINGIYQAQGLGVDVINMSFSTTQDSITLRKALVDASASGIALVSSAGNDGDDSVTYPAAYASVIGVAATDFRDHLASFSNYGPAVSVEAPGAFVVSTVPGGKYAAAWGTSFSAPMVSGEIALFAALRGRGQSDTNVVVNTADSIDGLNPGFEKMLGKGRINAAQALKVAK